MTEVTVTNNSAQHPLKISRQTRKSPDIEPSTPTARTRRADDQLSTEERKRLEALGLEVVTKTVARALGGERVISRPRWEDEGAPTLAHWITCAWERDATIPDAAPKGVRVSEAWSASKPYVQVAAADSVSLSLTDNLRFIVESKEPDSFVQVHNPSTAHTLALRQLDKSGAPVITKFLPPTSDGVLFLGPHGAVLEQRPT